MFFNIFFPELAVLDGLGTGVLVILDIFCIMTIILLSTF